MHLDVNGTRLWFDVDGPALVPGREPDAAAADGRAGYGGPGVYDHSYFKPDFARLAGHAQVVYLDLRGHGRSAWGDAAGWSFEAYADDIRVFCDTAGIARPIVLGHSMGGPVVLLYGARHPVHAAGLIVQSGFARWDPARLAEGFRRVACDDAAAIAGRSYGGEEVTDQEWARVFAAFGHIFPTRNARLIRPRISRSTHTDETHPPPRHRRSAPSRRLADAGLGRRARPRHPVAAAEEITGALPEGIARLEIIAGAGHFTWKGTPDRYWPMIIQFINGAIGPELAVA